MWPQYRIGGELKEKGGRPVRCREYTHVLGNTPIILGGVEIGYMQINMQWLRPEAWKGLGAHIGISEQQRENLLKNKLKSQQQKLVKKQQKLDQVKQA